MKSTESNQSVYEYDMHGKVPVSMGKRKEGLPKPPDDRLVRSYKEGPPSSEALKRELQRKSLMEEIARFSEQATAERIQKFSPSPLPTDIERDNSLSLPKN